MTDDQAPLALFQGFGIEIEYMIVDKERLSVLPVTDQILKNVAGDYVNEYENGDIAWSNELVLHVIELKTNGPAGEFAPLPEYFQANIDQINRILLAMNGQLMPAGMHPWMDPDQESRLWPHESSEIYASYNRIFDCRGHGWSNLQSMHVNLPFADEREFAQLHAAIRVLLPLMPAIAASTPVLAGAYTGLMDTRLETYRHNADRIPAITGQIIPEPIESYRDYRQTILQPMYDAIADQDPDKILQHEWLNSRGAIARFDRQAIEIRVLDVQETVTADIAIAALIATILKKLVAGDWSVMREHNQLSTDVLAEIFLATVRDGELAVIRHKPFLELFEFPDRKGQAQEVWQHLLGTVAADDPYLVPALRDIIHYIIYSGPLARRMRLALGPEVRQSHLEETWRILCGCLAEGQRFEGL